MKTSLCVVANALLLSCVVCESILTEKERSVLDVVHYTCVVGTDVQFIHITDALRGKYIKNNDLLKYLQCVFRAYGFENSEGKLNVRAMKNAIPSRVQHRSLVETAIDSCQNAIAPPTPPEIAYEFFKCFRTATQGELHWHD